MIELNWTEQLSRGIKCLKPKIVTLLNSDFKKIFHQLAQNRPTNDWAHDLILQT